MAWQPTKPGTTDLLFGANNTRKDIQENFAAIDTAWDINHVGIGDTNQGKHNFVHIRENSEPSTTTNEIGLWTQDYTHSSDGTELMIRRESNGVSIPSTAAYFSSSAGWTFLPSGILLKWGTLNGGSGDYQVYFATGTGYPAFTAVYSAQVTTYNSSSGDSDTFVRLKSVTTTSISIYCSARTTTGASSAYCNYLVIGKGV